MENTRHMTGVITATVLATSLLAACSQTALTRYQDSSIKFGEFGPGTQILVTNFPLKGENSGVDHDEVSSGRLGRFYRASVYDITDDNRYLGTLSYEGDHDRTQWLKKWVRPGRHRLMLIAENDFNHEAIEPLFAGEKADIIEVDVKASQTVYVTLSKHPQLGQPRFHQLDLSPEHARFCENLPEKHFSRRAGTIRSYMQEQHIDGNKQLFYRFCKVLSEQKQMLSVNEAGTRKALENAATIQYSRDQALKEWSGSSSMVPVAGAGNG